MNRNLTRSLLILLTVAALVVIALPGSAKPPEGKGKPPAEPPTTATCGTITLIGASGSSTFECDWTPENTSTPGLVTVETISGDVTRLLVLVRDSSPGDICVFEQWDRPVATEFEATVPLSTDTESYWESPEHWCSRFDGVPGVREDLNGKPLHLRIDLRAKKGTEVRVTLSPGQQAQP